MKKIFLSGLFVVTGILAIAQSDNKINIGFIDSLPSHILQEQRHLWIYLPYNGTPNPDQHYPVVYLLDGDTHFSSVVGIIQQLSQMNGNTVFPEMIIVGITNTDRTRDLTPTHVAADPPFMDSAASATSGGGEKFISFLEKELIPYINSNYPTAPYKILIGHSFGGLLVMQTFVHHTNLFNSYICIDPSMWWDHEKLLHEAAPFFKNQQLDGHTLYLAIANTMDKGMDIKNVMRDTSSGTRHIRAILQLMQTLENNQQDALRFKSHYYPDDSHGSVPLIATYDALRFIFDFYDLTIGLNDYFDSTIDIAGKIGTHYKAVSRQMGYEIKPPENSINELGYACLQRNQFNKARALFSMNTINYPHSGNVFDSYGDYFFAVGDKAKAMELYRKSLQLEENAITRKKLLDLLNE